MIEILNFRYKDKEYGRIIKTSKVEQMLFAKIIEKELPKLTGFQATVRVK